MATVGEQRVKVNAKYWASSSMNVGGLSMVTSYVMELVMAYVLLLFRRIFSIRIPLEFFLDLIVDGVH